MPQFSTKQSASTAHSAQAAIAQVARPIVGAADDYDALIDIAGSRSVVLIGEASHGTHEFYRERARITRRLIDDCGFTAVAVEADWPDAYRVNRYVMGLSRDLDADAALSDFRRFPAWMWRNRDVVEFVEWLRARNDAHSHAATKAGFYGLDLYSLQASIEAVIGYLDRVDPAEARRARDRYACFDHVGAEGQAYGYALAYEAAIPCENEVVAQLVELRRRAEAYLRRDGWVAEDELFFAEQNACVVRDAEEYYQQMYRSGVSSWNLRDRHMAATLDALREHLRRRLGHAKVVVWEHNSHVGDARATAMGARGELNVGQLARQRYGNECFNIGMTTYDGRVTAASDWGSAAERKHVRPALRGATRRCSTRSASRFWFATADRRVREESGGAAARARHRRDLPPRDRASEPLLRRAPRGAVRRSDPLRPYARARTARANARCGIAANRRRRSRPASEMARGEPEMAGDEVSGTTPGRPRRRLRRRVVAAVVVAVLLVGAGVVAVLWNRSGAHEASTSDARRRFARSSSTELPAQSVLRPRAGVYLYRGSGTEHLSLPPKSQTQGPRMPATVTHRADGCWTFRIDYSTAHWQTWIYCPRNGGLVELGGQTFERWDFVVHEVRQHLDVHVRAGVGRDPSDDARPVTSGSRRAPARARERREPRRPPAPYTFVGRETVDVGGTPVAAYHFHQVRTLSGSQTGTQDTRTVVRREGRAAAAQRAHRDRAHRHDHRHVDLHRARHFQLTSLTPQT